MNLSDLRQQPHLSASSIGEYVECSLLYKFGRIDRLPMEFKSDALEFGTCIHRVLEQYYSAKMIGEKMLLKDVHQIFETTWKGIAQDRDDIRYSGDNDHKALLMYGKDLLTTWYSKLPDDQFTILAIEEAFSSEITRETSPRAPVHVLQDFGQGHGVRPARRPFGESHCRGSRSASCVP